MKSSVIKWSSCILLSLGMVANANAGITFGVKSVKYWVFFYSDILEIVTDGTGTGPCDGSTSRIRVVMDLTTETSDVEYYRKMMGRAYDAALSSIESGKSLTLWTDDDSACGGDKAEIYGVKVGS